MPEAHTYRERGDKFANVAIGTANTYETSIDIDDRRSILRGRYEPQLGTRETH
jgi:hypothetical protein